MHPTATIVPVTAQLRRFIDRAPSEVFAAYRDIDRRVRWQPDPEEIIVLESHDFQVGGVDRFLYRSRHYPSLAGMVRYERIIDDECMVYTRRLSDTGDRTLAVSVVSWSLRPKGSGTEITLAEQTTSLDGSAPIEGSKYRLATMLDRLAAHLTVGG